MGWDFYFLVSLFSFFSFHLVGDISMGLLRCSSWYDMENGLQLRSRGYGYGFFFFFLSFFRFIKLAQSINNEIVEVLRFRGDPSLGGGLD